MGRKNWVVQAAVVLTALMLCMALEATATAQIFEKKGLPAYGREFAPGEVLVKFRPEASVGDIEGLNSRLGASVKRITPRIGAWRLRIPEGKMVQEMVREYSLSPLVEYAEPNYYVYALMTPNDPYYSYQWHLDNVPYGGIHMESAWDLRTGVGVIVGIIDTGVAYEDYGRTYKQAPDLANTSFVPGYDFVNDDTHPNDDNSHGTHVAGTVAQSTNNGIGVAGVAFQCSLMPVKVLDRNGSGTYEDVAQGIIWAADHGARVLNLSLGGPNPSSTLENAVAHAYTIKGVTIVAAAGNDASTTLSYPAAYDAYVIAVGATRYDETLAYYSNYGPSLDLVAPGGDLNVDQNSDGYGDGVLQNTFNPTTRKTSDFGYWFFQGTSMAAPHVSGVAALLIAAEVTGPNSVRDILQSTAEDKGPDGRDDTYGWGLVDAYKALQKAMGPVPNQPPVANAGPDQTVSDTDGNGTEAVTLDGSGSYDPDGTIIYEWREGETILDNAMSITAPFTVTGSPHVVVLTVTDDSSATATDTVLVTVEANRPPVANAGPDQQATVGQTVNFDGSGSTDDGTITSYVWNFGDGATGTGVTSHVYTAAGTYTVTLTVTDNGGLTGTDTAKVTVTEAPSTIMYVESITFGSKVAGPNKTLYTYVKVVDGASAALGGVRVEMTLTQHESGSSWNFAGDTGTDGTVKFTLLQARTGTYTATVTKLILTGYTWDTTKGVTSASCQLLNDGTVIQGAAKAVAFAGNSLGSASPNPANPSTEIRYSIGQPGQVTLKVYNTLGQVVRTLVDEVQVPSTYTVRWDGRDDSGIEVSSGIYLYRIVAGEYSQTKRMILLR